jgi:sugar lactone lactonase YvrE
MQLSPSSLICRFKPVALLSSLLILAACGGGGGGSGDSGGGNTGGGNPPPAFAGRLSVHAGALGGLGYADGLGSAARFNGPEGMVLDANGNLYVADAYTATVRKVSASGLVSTYAGIGYYQGHVDGARLSARFAYPSGLALAADGSLYVSDRGDHTIRKISGSGVVSTHAGKTGVEGSANGARADATFNAPRGMAADALGNLFIADSGNHTIRKIDATGFVSTVAGTAGEIGLINQSGANARFNMPRGVAVDSVGNLYVADFANHAVRKITTAGLVSTMADLTAQNCVNPESLVVDGNGTVYVQAARATCQVSAAGVVTRIAGDGSADHVDGLATNARFRSAVGIVRNASGVLYISDAFGDTIRKLDAGRVSTLAGVPSGIGDADGSLTQARFYAPRGLALDGAGNLFVSDYQYGTIRKISSAGQVSTFAGKSWALGNVDGQGADARFDSPYGMASDAAGNLYVTDVGQHTIRKITPAAQVSTLAGSAGNSGASNGLGAQARFNRPEAVAVDAAGNLYVADTNNHLIRKVSAAGEVSTLAGAGIEGHADGAAQSARFSHPSGVAVDAAGNVYVADSGNFVIRKITPAGMVSTLAGSAGVQGSGDGAGSAARFRFMRGLTIDASGNLYLSDYFNATVRKITPAGIVSTLVGVADGYSVVRTGSLPGHLNYPSFLAITGNRLYITDESAVLLAELP